MAGLETSFHTVSSDRVSANASAMTPCVFVSVRRDGASVTLFLTLEQARALIPQITDAVAECDDYAAIKAKRAEAA